jgi:hypothetical protein
VEVPEADELYGLPLREFVPARDALAKRLRSEGRREDAAEVAKLRRPSVGAWAVNQLMRTQRRASGELLEAGDALLEEQAGVLAGRRRAADLRAAAERHRAAVGALRAQAAGLLDERGRGPSAQTLERVGETLHAVSLDPALREDAGAGRLVDVHRHIGLGTPEDAVLGEVVRDEPEVEAEPGAGGRPEARAEREREAERAARRRAAAAESAARDATEAREAAQRRRDEAQSELEEAESAVESAVREEEAAADAARRLRAEAGE